MQKPFAALVGAAAVMPLLATAAPSFPDPSDSGASVPAVTVPPAFAGYRAYEDKEPGSWPVLNRAVMEPSGMAGMPHGQMPAPRSPADHDHAQHGEMAK